MGKMGVGDSLAAFILSGDMVLRGDVVLTVVVYFGAVGICHK